MQCPNCSSRLLRLENATYDSEFVPDYTFKCEHCGRTLMVFTTENTLEDLLVWTDEIPLESSLEKYIEERMYEHRAAHLKCPACDGSLERRQNDEHFTDVKQDMTLFCNTCKRCVLVIFNRNEPDEDFLIASDEFPPRIPYEEYLKRKMEDFGGQQGKF